MSSLQDLFEKLRRDSFSGEVDITSSQGHATILLHQGKFVWAHRTLDRAYERLQKVSWLQMPEPPFRNWPEFVIALLEVNPDNYARAVRLFQMDRLELFFRIFFWTNLEMKAKSFDTAPLLAPSELGFYTPRDFEPLLLEARKRVEEWPSMKQKMGSSRRIFMSQIEPSALQVDYSTESPGSISQSGGGLSQTPFTPEEIELLKHCDGRNTVQDLVRTLPEGEFLIVRRLLELWQKGAVRPKDDEDSVVSVHARTGEITARDILASLWVAFVFGVAFFSISRLIGIEPPPRGIPQEIPQALNAFRKMEGHFPLTLSELPSKLFLSKDRLRSYDYSLSDPTHYEIKVRSARTNVK
jgi:hypothetical protein